jgi:tyrosine phenol-lyase
VYAYFRPKGIPVLFDATRAVENAYMVQKRDPRYHNTQIRDILHEIMAHGDGCTVSGKKDFLINIGGLLGFKDNAEWARAAEDKLRIYEGGVHDGGLPAADLAAMARGVEEMLDDRYIRDRVEQTAHLANRLTAAGVPIVRPTGTHAVFVDVRRVLPHLDQDQYPAQRLAAEIYIETGVRAMERGNVRRDVTRTPGRTTARRSSWCASPSPGGSTPTTTCARSPRGSSGSMSAGTPSAASSSPMSRRSFASSRAASRSCRSP